MTVLSAQATTFDIDAELEKLESSIRQLKVQYDMFFAGSLPIPPHELRARVERMIQRLRRQDLQKYAHRFYFNALVTRFNTMSELWNKTTRRIEESGHRARPTGGPEVREQLVSRVRIDGVERHQDELQRLYGKYTDARRRHGDEGAPSFDNFVRGISRQVGMLQSKRGCDQIELRLTVTDDKVRLKARPVD